jgi:hypothetical protein
LLLVYGADELRRIGERVVDGIDEHLGEKRRDGTPGHVIRQALIEHVADHPLGLGPQDVERESLHLSICLAL